MPLETSGQQGTVDARTRGPICPQGNPPWASTVFSSGEKFFGPVTIPGNATLASILRDYFILSFAVALDPNSTPSSTARPVWPWYQSIQDGPVVLRLQDSGLSIKQDPDNNERFKYLLSSI